MRKSDPTRNVVEGGNTHTDKFGDGIVSRDGKNCHYKNNELHLTIANENKRKMKNMKRKPPNAQNVYFFCAAKFSLHNRSTNGVVYREDDFSY